MKLLDLVITPGDPEGIGAEVTAKALSALRSKLPVSHVVIVGSKAPFKKYLSKLRGMPIQFIEPPARSSPGYQSGWAVEVATEFVMAAPRSRALVTGPISKERLQGAGFHFKGHTDFLAHLTRTQAVTMMLANEIFRVALVTNHCSLDQVSKKITREALLRTFQHATAFCKTELRKKSPRIAVLGLNPHAGECGILGSEEHDTITPAIQKFQRSNPSLSITGPYPADTFFALEKSRPPRQRFDVIIAQYHDQGLIPVKLSDFSNSLNLTLGLPIIRTSVDHGTAFDIAGKNKADPGSMIYAIEKAIEYLTKRSKA